MMNKQEKFEQIFYEIFPKVKAFAWKILQSEEDAEDIAQDVFAKLWNTPETWEDKETWHNYIYTMTRNHIFNFLKHKAVEQKYQQQSEPDIIGIDGLYVRSVHYRHRTTRRSRRTSCNRHSKHYRCKKSFSFIFFHFVYSILI